MEEKEKKGGKKEGKRLLSLQKSLCSKSNDGV